MTTIQDKQDEITQMFNMLGDWQERYRAIIELGRELEPLPDEHRIDANKVKGCQSQVWLHAHYDPDADRLLFQADSDAAIVRGLIALLLQVYSGHSPAQILATDPSFIDAIGLNRHLSQSRANGLSAMIKKLRLHASICQQARASSP